MTDDAIEALRHEHLFLGEAHERNERRVWLVIAICGAMMLIEIFGGLAFGSIALVADGLHMSTHAGALLLAALAYTFARRHAADPRFTFGTGKLGDLAGFTSAIVLAMIALLIGYEAVSRIFQPVAIHFREAIPIAGLGLCVNVASAWLLSAGGHQHHHHGHGHSHDHADHHHEDAQRLQIDGGALRLEIFEDGVPPRFRLRSAGAPLPDQAEAETVRPDGGRQVFAFRRQSDFLESVEEIPEPHAFAVEVRLGAPGRRQTARARFDEHDHHHSGRHDRDNNMRAAVVHVIADAAVSVLVIVGLLLARLFHWLWMDPLAGIVGALVIASWSYGLIRDTGAILLDMNPDRDLSQRIRGAIETAGGQVADLHLWRLGPGHLGAIVCVACPEGRPPAYYREQLARFGSLSHVTIEVDPATPG